MDNIKLDIQLFAGDTGSGTITFPKDGYLQGKIDWSYSKISDNTVRVTCTLYAHRTNSSTTTGKSWKGNVTCDGHSHSFTGFSSSTSISSTYKKFATYTDDIVYSGAKTITISGWVNGPSGTALEDKRSSGSGTVELPNLSASFNLNILLPDGSEPYSTGTAGSVELSINGGTYNRVVNEPASSYPINTTFTFRNFTPGQGLVLDSVSGATYDSTTQTWSATLGSGGLVVTFYTAWQRHYLDLNGSFSANGTTYTNTSDLTYQGTAYGQADVFINDVRQVQAATDYYSLVTYGDTYVMGNIAAKNSAALGVMYEGSSPVSGTMGTSDISVRLKFRVVRYNIKYDVNQGTGSIQAQTKYWNNSITLTSSQPTRSGYDFKGWNTNSSGTGTNYSSGATLNVDYAYTEGANVTLYAKWVETKPSNVRFTSYQATSPFNISLAWTCTGLNITKYVIHYKPAGGTERTVDCGTSTSLNLAVNEETTYEIWVTATNAGGSTDSSHIQVTTPADQAKIRIYDGSTWKQGKTYVYNGSSWVKAKKVYVYDGSQWKINSNN